MGVKEYFLFTPRQAKPSTLEGYRRSASGQFEHVRADANLCLASEILGLTFVVRGKMLRVVTPDGEVLPTLAEAEAARRQAEEHARQAEEGRRRAEEERAQERSRANSAEAEVARLREELGRLRRLTNRDESSG